MTDTDKGILLGLMKKEIGTAPGRKVLEFGSGTCSLAADLRGELEYLACTDKSADALASMREMAAAEDIFLIPDDELGEDCYFGRFHLVYTLFGFHGLPHLVDEVMRLRRLILKGGRIAVFGFADDGFAGECRKQLGRCGFTGFDEQSFVFDGRQAFLLMAQK